jgi:hypothetical protein
VVRAVGAQRPSVDHRQHRRAAVYERGATAPRVGHPSPYGGTYGQGPGPGDNLPSWMIIDQHCRDRYLFAGLQGGQRIPRKWLESGTGVTADTIAELAEKVAIDPEGLARTI